MKVEILAYLAGAIDSDGTIGIKRSTYAMRVRKDAGAPVFSERVALRQVTPHIPKLLRATFGGSIYITKPSAAKGRPLWSWAATDLRALACLTALMPFLRVKRKQAMNCLALRKAKVASMKAKVPFGRGHIGAAARPKRLTDRMERLYEKAKALNKVGI
jgi:hypothetical protein